MNLQQRIEAFSMLGDILRDTLSGKSTKHTSQLTSLIETQHLTNPWFTPENIRMAVKAIADLLTSENLTRWCSDYPGLNFVTSPVNVGIVMAGNIPLVGFHDFLSVLISGNRVIAKISSKDPDLINLIADILISVNPEFKNRTSIADGILTGFDMVIATGSDNSSRYFEYYFGKYPHIIRKNRNSVAVIDGTESNAELEALGLDVFSYFGLGCRNVSKLYVPEKYDFSEMIHSWTKNSVLINHSKYAGNYDFRKAIFLVNKEKFIDTGFLLLKEGNGFSSPVAVLFFEYYKTSEQLHEVFKNSKDRIQCIVGRDFLPFGRSQLPALWDYADGIDTIEFLLKKKITGIL
jgi:hypothetical protein